MSIWVNAHLPEGKQATKPEDFIPGAKEAQPERRFEPGVIPITPEQMRQMFIRGGAKVVKGG